jgi:hypothetical protein
MLFYDTWNSSLFRPPQHLLNVARKPVLLKRATSRVGTLVGQRGRFTEKAVRLDCDPVAVTPIGYLLLAEQAAPIGRIEMGRPGPPSSIPTSSMGLDNNAVPHIMNYSYWLYANLN